MGHEAIPQPAVRKESDAERIQNAESAEERDYRPEAAADWAHAMETIESELAIAFESAHSPEERLERIAALHDMHVAEVKGKPSCTRLEYYREIILAGKRDELKYAILATEAARSIANRSTTVNNAVRYSGVSESANQNLPDESLNLEKAA